MSGNPEDTIQVGSVLNHRYRLEKLVGEGGMGAVYEATHLELERKVAVKTLHPEHVTDRRAWVRFRQEAKAAASIGHDNICDVIDFGEAENGSPSTLLPGAISRVTEPDTARSLRLCHTCRP